ncbi:amidase [Microbulbifer sp. OS29]|uniref:Amidase n=1 Tax=Microbulbifer okhotskensis TaxID=2926617 RepID=A0A9X2EPH5_9GAMM|nr:amidase [Microbulbifer okhotskensis]MCO1336052.1 amidase [Microbulbifer okhotskensis]
MSDFVGMTAVELLRGYATKSFSPVDVTAQLLDRIERVNPLVNAFCLIDRKTSLAHARDSEQRYFSGDSKGLLDGVPVAIKDVFLTPMWPTVYGSKTVDPETTLGCSTSCIAALQRHGYTPIGKTTTPEYGWKGVTDSAINGITRNPWDTEKTCGGSSGGSAVAVALGLCPLALGSDGGGSIRIPASFCGVVGFKPSFGQVPHWPRGAFSSLVHVGPLASTVEDCALMMNVLSEPDHRDMHAIPRRNIDFLAALSETHGERVRGLRIAYSPSLGYTVPDPEVEREVSISVKAFQELGAEVVEIDPGIDDPSAIFGCLFSAGIANLLRAVDSSRRALMEAQLVDIAEQADQMALPDYLSALKQRDFFTEGLVDFFLKYDLLVTPTLPITAFTAGCNVPENHSGSLWYSWTPYTYPFNLSGHPAISVNCGFSNSGLPIGLQIIGRKYADELVLCAAAAFQIIKDKDPKAPTLSGAG